MKHRMSLIVCTALLGLGLSALGSAALANAAGLAGTFTTSAAASAGIDADAKAFKVHDRYYHRKWRRNAWRRHYRPRASFEFHFGTGSPYYSRPYYARPYYARPRYVYPKYVRPVRPHYRQRVRLTRAHVRWCNNRYRSYRASDNTFQPYRGPRRACRSPYLR